MCASVGPGNSLGSSVSRNRLNSSTPASTYLSLILSTDVTEFEESMLMDDHYKPGLGAFDCSPIKNGLSTGEFVEDARCESRRYSENTKEESVWEVYNSEAKKVDIELVNDWTASLNFLLVFASIFAAVLTAFIVDSKKMLEQDPTELLVDIMVFYINKNPSNITPISYTPPQFHPTFAAVSINCLLFASLGASLGAALSSVLALQWVSNYDAAINRGGSSPEDRAKRRQFRFAGVVAWKMGEIIAALPLLLHSSVALFLVGATQWMWTLNHTVGVIVAGGTGLAVLLYATTTILSAVYDSAPLVTLCRLGYPGYLGHQHRSPVGASYYSLSTQPFDGVPCFWGRRVPP